jgi:hypothetical protein
MSSKDAMRKAMPTVAQIVDDFREFMTEGAKVVYASENGHVIDRREPENAFDIPPNYFPCRQIERKERK